MQLRLQGETYSNRYEFHDEGEAVAVKMVEFDKIKGVIQKRLIKNEIKNLHALKGCKNILKLYEILTTS